MRPESMNCARSEARIRRPAPPRRASASRRRRNSARLKAKRSAEIAAAVAQSGLPARASEDHSGDAATKLVTMRRCPTTADAIDVPSTSELIHTASGRRAAATATRSARGGEYGLATRRLLASRAVGVASVLVLDWSTRT
jgi:hypothetical protein